jgi:hypothetical protein
MHYMAAVISAICVMTACQDNENWTTVKTVPQGYYVAGEATVYSAVAPAAGFLSAPLSPRDGESADQFPGMYSKFTYLKAGKEFTIMKADADGNTVSYGKGNTVSGETTALLADGPAYTVPADGLYFLLLNSADNQLTILAATWEAIGEATPGGWSTGMPLTPSFDATGLKVNFTADLAMSKGNMKFRFIDWEVLVPYGSADVRIFSNMGSTSADSGDAALSGSPIELKDGGKDIAVTAPANYTLTLSFDLKTSKFTASVVQGEIIEPAYPEHLYMCGDALQGWSWDVATELIPVNGTEGHFWSIAYLNTGGFKFAPVLEWSGDFGIAESNADAAGNYTKGTNNVNVATAGYYQIHVNLAAETITISEPQVILKGDAAAGGWDSTMATDAFTVDNANKILVSNPFANSGELRISAVLSGIDWWRSEFIVLDGKIAYRGNGGDQERVNVTAGGKVTLNFGAGTGVIE